jgi:2-dehydro-3-deoxyphosphogluconate aldolase/(4S)-4-hydroxy-2-oxoglutarate aldolase
MNIMEEIRAAGFVPVVVIEDIRDAVPTAKALLAGRIGVMEITFRTSCAEEAIRAVANDVPEMIVGAGTILSAAQGQKALAAGARFIVSPGFDEALVSWCNDVSLPVVPGCVTPTEIMKALAQGLTVVKFFPANIYGGLSAMNALAAPFGNIKFIPTGGVGEDNLLEYLSQPYVFAVGGSWVCTRDDISQKRFAKITELSLKAADQVAKLSGKRKEMI